MPLRTGSVLRKSYKLLFVVNVDWFFLSHRLPIALAAKERGFEVMVAAGDTGDGRIIEEHGLHFIPLPVLEQSESIFSESRMTGQLRSLYKKVKPDLVHHVTIRPVLYGSIAARMAGVPAVVNALSGLGYMYINHTPKNRILKPAISFLFRRGFKHPNSRLILQNMDDVNLILNHHLIEEKKIRIIKGSGVDVEKFAFTPEKNERIDVVYTGRMLWDKGIGEFVEAARILNKKGVQAMFHLYGAPYPANPQSIPPEQLETWNKEEYIVYHGFQENMVEALEQANIVCLPSYREGLPKTLLEAAAVGRAIVTTDVPGCREIVEDGVNGYLVPVKNAEMLADRLEKLINEPETRAAFGRRGREKVIREFSVEMVVEQTMRLYRELLE